MDENEYEGFDSEDGESIVLDRICQNCAYFFQDDKDEDATPDVTKLPSTGTGASDNTGVLAMAAAAAAALAGAGALSLRKR